MSDTANVDQAVPAQTEDEIAFPPLPEPTNDDFDDEITAKEREYFKTKFADLTKIINEKLHCTACDRHLGCSTKNESRMKQHPMLRTLVCHTCHSFYNSGEFDKGDDGSELYCRWCGQGGQVYCCSDCPHVFCAKCIKRNFGLSKIKEIENTDDWKCFKCNPECLIDLRAICWALLRYCDLKNKVVFQTDDPEMKEKYAKVSALDISTCCKFKKRREKTDSAKKKKEESKEENSAKKINKIPPTIQVKKFASINNEDLPKVEKKPVKRPASPKLKPILVKNPTSLTPCGTPPGFKKVRMQNVTFTNSVTTDKKSLPTYTRIVPRARPPIVHNMNNYNGYNTGLYSGMPRITVPNDNINLSLDSLTQGLDLANMDSDQPNNDVVCTPDFPLEPLCEVTEDQDDDVQCITPGPVAAPIVCNPPPLVPRVSINNKNDNIVQMTENDVTVNAVTGGLKFRVDPQTLSSNKMYRLPDGRVFAININPNMPGGYSATIVSVSDGSGKLAPRGETFAAKLSTVTVPQSSTPLGKRQKSFSTNRKWKSVTDKNVRRSRECDMKVPVEWYRYNLIDAIDALEYSLSRLNKVKKEATTVHLRTRTVGEMKYLHKTLDQLLATSSKRFNEIRDNLNTEFKHYLKKKTQNGNSSEEDDDVLILPDEDPISVDENSMDSMNGSEKQEVDLTEVNSSEHNDSTETRNSCQDDQGTVNDPLQTNVSQDDESASNKNDKPTSDIKHKNPDDNDETDAEDVNDKSEENNISAEVRDNNTSVLSQTNKEIDGDKFENKKNEESELLNEFNSKETKANGLSESGDNTLTKTESPLSESNDTNVKTETILPDCDTNMTKKDCLDLNESSDDVIVKTDLITNDQMKDAEMNDEMIDNLLDDTSDNVENMPNLMDIAELEAQ